VQHVVDNVEQAKHHGPAQVGGHKLVAHHCSNMGGATGGALNTRANGCQVAAMPLAACGHQCELCCAVQRWG
jgi:hypothetical protein